MQPHNQPPVTPPPSPQPEHVPPAENPFAPQPGYVAQPQNYQPHSPAPGTVAEQYPVDYLNQIAGKAQVKKMNPVVLFSLIGGILLVVGLAMFFMIRAASPPSASKQVYTLQARLDTLSKITTEQGKRLTQNELSVINSTLGTSLTSMTTNLGTYMKARGLKTSDKAAVAAKNTEKTYYEALSKKLSDAYLTGTLDLTYATEMTYQLGILKSKMTALKAAAGNSKSYNEFYATNVKSVETVTDLLAKFQNTK